MRVGIVSDTHDDTAAVERAVERFSGEVEAVIHCGDVVAPFSATPFDADAGYDFYCVRGNNDGEWKLRDAVEEFGTYLGEMGELELGGATFAAYHGTSGPIVDALVECGRYDYVVHGHTHERVHEDRGGTVSVNPGGKPIPPAPDPQCAVVVDTESGDVTFHELG